MESMQDLKNYRKKQMDRANEEAPEELAAYRRKQNARVEKDQATLGKDNGAREE